MVKFSIVITNTICMVEFSIPFQTLFSTVKILNKALENTY